jgi:GNAT superfamily N-acetyltransferase
LSEPRIVEGLRPGALGFIIGEHGRYYSRHWGFGAYFEAKVAAELASYAGRADDAADRFFLALDAEGRILGTLVIDAHDPASASGEAHLRWFILSEAARGQGIGQGLMQAAMAHVDRLSLGCWLTTIAGLDAARHLYEKVGFSLQSECEGDSWGVRVTEQLFRRSPKN